MLYATVGEFLLGNPDYGSLCEGFHDFYSTYEMMPCGTLAVTDCSELDNMAAIMKSINDEYVFDDSLQGGPQRVVGYLPSSFMTLPIMSSPSALTLSRQPASGNSWSGLFPIKPIRVNFILGQRAPSHTYFPGDNDLGPEHQSHGLAERYDLLV